MKSNSFEQKQELYRKQELQIKKDLLTRIKSEKIEELTEKIVEWITWDIVEELTWEIVESTETGEETVIEEIKYNEDRSDIVTYLPFRILGFIKIKRVNVKGRFKLLGLFNPMKYHTHYDEPKLYTNIYKREQKRK